MKGSEGQTERERLATMYGNMGAGELLGLKASAGDLTEVAQEALAEEMKRRGLQEADIEEALPPDRSPGKDGRSGWTTLHVFSQTFEAQAAFKLLERRRLSSRSRTGRWTRAVRCERGRGSSWR